MKPPAPSSSDATSAGFVMLTKKDGGHVLINAHHVVSIEGSDEGSFVKTPPGGHVVSAYFVTETPVEVLRRVRAAKHTTANPTHVR